MFAEVDLHGMKRYRVDAGSIFTRHDLCAARGKPRVARMKSANVARRWNREMAAP